jgi:hypothetical protein
LIQINGSRNQEEPPIVATSKPGNRDAIRLGSGQQSCPFVVLPNVRSAPEDLMPAGSAEILDRSGHLSVVLAAATGAARDAELLTHAVARHWSII